MSIRIDFHESSPEAMKALIGVESYLENTRLDPKIMGLVKLRASQINGCAYCVDMHCGELKKIGVSEGHLNLVVAWRESLCFSEKERAVLRWTETVTLISTTHASDEEYSLVKKHFSNDELVDLTILIGQINLWNRLAVSFRLQPQVRE